MKHLTVKEKEIESFEKMKSVFHYKNNMAAPKNGESCFKCWYWNSYQER